MATASDVLAVGDRLAGENEAAVGQNNTTVNRHYAGFVGQPYCGKYLQYCMELAGCDLLKGCSNPAYVPTLRSYLEAKVWKVPNSGAKPGDIFIYKKDQHTGFIRKALGGLNAVSSEGNWNGVRATVAAAESGSGPAYEGIGYRRLYLDANYEVYRPPYGGSGSGSAPAKSGKEYVKDWQKWLGVSADGKAGANTLDAAERRLALGLLTAHPLRTGDSGDAVKVLQGLLYAAGYDPNGLDGKFGSGCAAAVKAFQAKRKLTADGEAGKATVAALMGWK